MQNLKESLEAGIRERLGNLRMKATNRDALIQDIVDFVLVIVKDRSAGQINIDNQAVIMTPNVSSAVDSMKLSKLNKPQDV